MKNKKKKKKLEEQLSKNLDIGKIKNEKDQIIKNLKEKILNFDSQLKSKEDIINKLKSENDAAKKIYTKELDELRSINKSMNNKQNEIINLKKKIKSEKDSMESKYREEIDRINFQHTLEINEIQIKLDSQISKLKIENLQLKENYEKLLKSKNNIIINENNITEINGPIKINYENLNDNLTHQRNNFKYNQNILYLKFLIY